MVVDKSKLIARFFLFISSVFCLLAIQSCDSGKVELCNLRCEYAIDPIGIDTPVPRFTWSYKASSGRDFRQIGIQLLLSESKEELLSKKTGRIWQSPMIETGETCISLDSLCALRSHTAYYWQVVAWNEAGDKVSSPIATFETAFMPATGWQGKWISDNRSVNTSEAPMLRKTFEIDGGKQISKGRLYVSAAGYYHISINGKAADPDAFLSPGFTHYDKRNLYNTIDVTSLLQPGKNVITVVLGNGFYNAFEPVATWCYEQARWRGRASVISELHIFYSDQTKDIVVSDSTWRVASSGPYVQNNIYSGDTYDARLEIEGWDKPQFDDSSWAQASIVCPPSGRMVAEASHTIRKMKEIKPVYIQSFGDTIFVCDFGVNLSGTCLLKIKGESGTRVEMQYGELLKRDGRIEMRNLDIYYKPLEGLAFQTDVFILNEDYQEFLARFSYKGFRYVEVRSDRPLELNETNIAAIEFHSDLKPVGQFECSDSLLNKIWESANRSYLSNAMSIPTDCPQREKNGWTADAHITIDLGLMNFDGIRFYEKWVEDIIDNQDAQGRISGIIPSSGWGYDDWIGPVWDAAMFIVPMAIYHYYGDTKCISRVYETCRRYLGYLSTREDGDGCVTYGIGDWVPYHTKTPTEYTTSCYYYLDHLYMARFSELLGYDGTIYKAKAEYLKTLINKKYFDEQKGIYANGSQTAQALALYLGIVPRGMEQLVADKLCRSVEENGGYLDFGVLGSKTVLRMLSQYGHADVAYRMATKRDVPSWGAWMATGNGTMAETWVLSPDFRDASLNHMFLGDINAWMYSTLAGINFDPQQPGFKHTFIRPCFVKDLNWVRAEYESVRGLIRSEWIRKKNGEICLYVEIPVNTTATIEVGDKRISVKPGQHKFVF